MTDFLYAVTVTTPTALGLLPYAVVTATPERVRVWLATEEELSPGSPEWAEFQARLGDALQAAGVTS